MTTYGYIRVSTKDQNVSRQVEQMRGLGITGERLFVDHASGKDFDRPEYQRLLKAVRRGDKIVVDSLDRLGRNYDALIEEWKRLTKEEGVDIQALDMDFMDSEYFARLGDIGKLVEDMVLGILSWAAEHERLEMHRRQAMGIARARAEGRYLGRRPVEYPPEKLREARRALDEEGKAAAARVLGCHRNTVYNLIADGRL